MARLLEQIDEGPRRHARLGAGFARPLVDAREHAIERDLLARHRGRIVARAEAFGIPARAIDGNDVLAVDAAAGEAIEAVRSGDGPRFIHAKTYRLMGRSASDHGAYRPREEVEAAWARDRIGHAAEVLRGAGVEPRILEMRRTAALAEMRRALAAAAAAPWPEPAGAYDDVQDLGGWRAAEVA